MEILDQRDEGEARESGCTHECQRQAVLLEPVS